MPDLRKDPIVGRWVIVAKRRAKRPHDFVSQPTLHAGRFCPFCEGNEHATPGEILAYRNPGAAANREGWRVRVVPNKFPALEIEGDLQKRGDGIYDMMRGVGAHEVIIESPKHVLSTSDLSDKQLREVFWVYRDRLADLKKDRRLVYGMIFKNVGAGGRRSLEHTHSQLIVTPIVPITGARGDRRLAGVFQLSRPLRFLRHDPSGASGREADRARFAGLRGIAPFASRFPFETWILPKQHSSHYENIQKSGVDESGPRHAASDRADRIGRRSARL